MYKPFTKKEIKIILLSLNTLKNNLDAFPILEQRLRVPHIREKTINYLVYDEQISSDAMMGISLASVYAHDALRGQEPIDTASLNKMLPHKNKYEELYKKFAFLSQTD